MEKYRGFIDGGLCVRRVEDFIVGSERRYFVLNRTPYAAEPGAAIPEPVVFCSDVIPSPFFSVDVARLVPVSPGANCGLPRQRTRPVSIPSSISWTVEPIQSLRPSIIPHWMLHIPRIRGATP